MLHGYQKPLSGEKVGVVFGSFAPLHQGHLDCIMRAKKENDGGCIVIVCGFDGDKGGEMMPLKRRYRYVREFFADDDLLLFMPSMMERLALSLIPMVGSNGWVSSSKFLIKPQNLTLGQDAIGMQVTLIMYLTSLSAVKKQLCLTELLIIPSAPL